MILTILIFYYCFSLLFMIGYTNMDELNKWYEKIMAILLIIISAPIMLPVNIGYYIAKHS